MFEGSRSLSLAGAKKWKAELLKAFATIEQRISSFPSTMSNPNSMDTAQSGPASGGGAQQPQTVPEVPAQSHVVQPVTTETMDIDGAGKV